MSLQNEHKQTRVSSHSIPAPLLLRGQTDTWNKKREGYWSVHRAFHLLPCLDAESDTKETAFLLTLAWFAFGTCFSFLTSAAGQICQKLQGGSRCLCDREVQSPSGDEPWLGQLSKERLGQRKSFLLLFSQEERQGGKRRFQLYPAMTEKYPNTLSFKLNCIKPTWFFILQNVLFPSVTHISHPELQVSIQSSSLQQIKSREPRETGLEYEHL